MDSRGFLSPDSLASLPQDVQRPAYDRREIATGIVHFGPGAFHRAHQAHYVDDLLHTDARWGLCEVSLRSAPVIDALAAQDGLYTLTTLGEPMHDRVIGAVREMLVAPRDPGRVLARLASPEVAVVTLTITEKGYCLTPQGELDDSHPDIQADLATPGRPHSAIGFIAEAMRLRRAAGLPPLTVISCDNQPDNGHRLRGAVIALVTQRDRGLADWIDAEAAFPRTMVDSITPATHADLEAAVARRLGVRDRWPVQREPFRQWVIERDPRMRGPDWSAVGADLTDDVAGFETCKLRLLNGAHSCLAYAGLLMGMETVAEAMDDGDVAAFVEGLMLEEAAPALTAPPGFDVTGYARAIQGRFANPAIRHLLAQIAWDGSHKLPIRLFPTIVASLRAGRRVDRVILGLACWLRFLRRQAVTGRAVVDPLAERLADIARACSDEAAGDVAAFLALDAVFPSDLLNAPQFRERLTEAYGRLVQSGDRPFARG